MKRKAIILFILVIIISLTGCQNEQKSSEASSESQKETVTATNDEATIEDTSYAEYGVTFSYDEATETLTFSGNGIMQFDEYSDEYFELEDIKKPTHVVVSSGVTTIQDWVLSYSVDGNTGTDRNHFDKIETVELPDTLREIGNESFAWCKGLKSINIPKSVQRIGKDAFESCNSIKEFVIPEGVRFIGYGAFQECEALEKVELPSTLLEVSESLCYSCERLRTVVIADGTKKIGEDAFAWCSGMDDISLGKTVEKIVGYAFYHCSSLSSIELPDSLREISEGAFLCCDKLKSITVPASVDTIGEDALGYTEKEINDVCEHVKLDGFVIKGYKNTAAEKYAKENGFEFIALD